LGQGAFQLTVLAWMLSPGGAQLVGGDTATQYTLLFNTFVIMQLFNQVNSRKIHDEADVLSGLNHAPQFLTILGLEAALQVAIVQAGGRAFSTVPLSPTLWGVSIGFGALTLLLRQALRLIPTEPKKKRQLLGPAPARR